MSKPIDFSAYNDWLKQERYQAGTRELSIRNLQTALATPTSKKLASYLIPALQRYLRFVAETHKNPAGPSFAIRAKKQGIEASAKIKKTGKRSKPALSEKSLAVFRAKLRAGDDVDKLIAAYLFSGQRVTEFLETSCKDVFDSTPDKLTKDWIKSATDVGWTERVSKLLCETDRCAYSRMRQRIKEHALKLKLSLDLDTLYLSRKGLIAQDVAA